MPANSGIGRMSGNGPCFACFSGHEPHNGAGHGLSMIYRYGARVIVAGLIGTPLAAKPFLVSLLVITVLAVVGFLRFDVVGNLVAVNRALVTYTMAAARLAASPREAN